MVPLSEKRGPGFTLFGAIGTCLTESTFMIGEATSIGEVIRFIKSLAEARKDKTRKPFLVMVRKLLDDHEHLL
jgi:hypothetical protein